MLIINTLLLKSGTDFFVKNLNSNIEMNPPQVYPCFPSWTLLPQNYYNIVKFKNKIKFKKIKNKNKKKILIQESSKLVKIN